MAVDANDYRITAYVFGELSDEQRVAFEAEMAGSVDLRQMVDEIRLISKQLERGLEQEPPLTLQGPQRERLQRAIEAHRVDGRKDKTGLPAADSPRHAWRRTIWVCAAAASLLILLGLVYPRLQTSKQITQQADLERLTTNATREAAADWEQSESRLSSRTSAMRPAESPGPPLANEAKKFEPPSQLPVLASPTPAETSAAVVGPASGPKMSGNGLAPSMGMEAAMPADPNAAGYGGMMGAPGGDMYGGAMGGMSGMMPGAMPGMSPGMPASRVPYGDAYDGMPIAGSTYVDALEARTERETMPGMPAVGSAPYPGLQGMGPGSAGDRHAPISENAFVEVMHEPLSTFSIDVDTASYSKVRMYLMEHGVLPRPDAVRIEELVNYFPYDYAAPTGDVPFAAHVEVAGCPWAPQHRLVRIGIKGRELDRLARPASNLVFLLDVSGSMDQPNRLPLVKRGMQMLVQELGENDRVAIVVYAGAAGMVLDSTTGDRQSEILSALDRLNAGGSTNGGAGIQLAYQTALDHFIAGGVNRVLLCTDGDFNVGVTGTDELVRVAEQNAKTGVFLSVLGFGMGNHNDDMLEQISNKGNGNYAFIDTEAEARKVLVEQMTGTLVTIAKDVKIQVEFNPAAAQAYRLIGYENRMLAALDFNDDRKDAGEIGAGHTVTALYEVVPAGGDRGVDIPPVDELRYRRQGKLTGEAKSGELLSLKIRYKPPEGDTSEKLVFPVTDQGLKFGQASREFRFAAAVASFGMLLRNSRHKGNATFAGVQEIAVEAASGDSSGYRQEFLQLVKRAEQISGGR